MDFTGIVAEYDPFHNGHAAQLAAVRAAGAQCIAVCMSSGAVQRGGVPILPESVRVRAALDAGADLVVALPAPYACATAEQFAAAGVHLLAALGCDTLAFGAETPDAAALLDTARLLDGEELNARIRQNLATGMTYAAARAAAADALHPGTGGLLRTPNNILGIEYCKALLGQNAPLRPVTIRREGSAHDGTLAPDTHPSASGLRALLRQGKREEALSLLPPAVARAYELEEAAGRAPVFWENSHRAILARLRSMTAADFAALACPRGWQVLAADLPEHGARRGDGVPLDPWHAAPELRALLGYAKGRWQHTALRCTSLGAWFSLLAFAGERLEQALFVSPVVDMEGLIRDMMGWAGVSEAQLEAAGELDTPFGETLSWPYLQYVRAHPVSRWPTPTALLYASGDAMLRRTAVEDFARRFGGALTVLEGGEHWFHTPEQLAALHRWESDVLEQMK